MLVKDKADRPHPTPLCFHLFTSCLGIPGDNGQLNPTEIPESLSDGLEARRQGKQSARQIMGDSVHGGGLHDPFLGSW